MYVPGEKTLLRERRTKREGGRGREREGVGSGGEREVLRQCHTKNESFCFRHCGRRPEDFARCCNFLKYRGCYGYSASLQISEYSTTPVKAAVGVNRRHPYNNKSTERRVFYHRPYFKNPNFKSFFFSDPFVIPSFTHRIFSRE